MDRNSEEYAKFKAEYEEKERYKKEHPEEYPYFVYFQFGWHNMTYMTKEEVEDAVKFYKLYPDGKGGYMRVGRQPIFITKRNEMVVSEERDTL